LPESKKEVKSPVVEIIENEKDLDFKKGNNPKVMRTRYQEEKKTPNGIN
jgi:hypothetical protein